jgi:uncharacterized SAM-dependent methyltransferase
MAHKSIFIASASESKQVANIIARELERRGYRPMSWWKEFPPGSITIERLMEIARRVDGAIFICSGIDKAWYRSDTVSMPRDNIILEFGMFIQSLGLKRTLLLKDEGTKLPTDLHSVAYENLLEDISTVAEKVADHFDRVFDEAELPLRNERLNLIADPEVIPKFLSKEMSSDWLMRTFYIGLEGAKAWLNVASDPEYQSEEVKAELRRIILDMIKNLDVRTFVSLGPGDGILDRDIAIILRNREPWLQYIPVDISDGLLQKSYELLSQQVIVPIGILGDFEDRLNFISHHVRLYANSPILFSIIGNTFGNLDSYEFRFMHNIKNYMSKSDYLMIELAAIKKGSLKHTQAPSMTSLSKGFQRFLYNGMARKLGVSADGAFNDIDKFLRMSVSNDGSDVPGALTLELRASVNDQLGGYVRRYDLEILETWLQDRIGFKVVDRRRIASTTLVDRGLVLVKRG